MIHSIDLLLDIRPDNAADLDQLLNEVRQQEQASRGAGFDHVARICRSMANCLEGVLHGDQPGTIAVLDTLLDVCRAVENHADAIAATVTAPTRQTLKVAVTTGDVAAGR